MESEHDDAPNAKPRDRGPEPRVSTFDDAPLLSGGALEVATEPAEGTNGAQESFSARTPGLRLKRIIVAIATVTLIAIVLISARIVHGGGTAQAAPPQPDPAFTEAILNDATSAISTQLHSHLLFQPAPAPASGSDPSSDAPDPQQPPPWSVFVATNTTIQPDFVSKALTIHIPPGTADSLLRIQIFGMNRDCNLHSAMCLCGGSAALPPILQAAAPEVSLCEPIDCRQYLLQPIIVPPADAYEHQDWFKLHLPCTLLSGHKYTIEWVSSAERAFRPTTPYPADSQPEGLPPTALIGSPKFFLPSTVARGAQQAFMRFTVTAPTPLVVLTATAPSGLEVMHAGGMRTQGFKTVKGISANMLAIAVGAFDRLATGFDTHHRRVSVWALPGATPEDAEVPWQILSNATAAWADFTGQPLPGLGKLDMLVTNGDSPWSSSQHGLLLMDRFRTLWRGGVSTASDLVRCAHVICHETGHLWFGGLLQTLNKTGKPFIEESTTSYGEVACVSRALGGPLAQRQAFTRSFFPGFGDTRSLHTGAAFHALDNLAGPEGAAATTVASPAAWYTKGAAFLHMLESYADAAVMPGLMHEALRGFLDTFAHSAVTATDLLCYLAHTLAGCPIGDADGPVRCRPLRVPGPAGAAAAANATVLSGGATGSSCATVVPWLHRLEAWLEEPGVQVVEVYQTPGAAGAPLELQALLRPNELPGQPTDDTPLWVPVSLVSSAAAAVTPGGNTTAREQRWLEVFPPWEDRHRIAVGGDPACADPAAGGGPDCGRPLASPPLQVPPDNGVWLPKAREGPFLTSIPDEGTQAAIVRELQRFRLNVTGHTIADGHPDMAALQAFSSLLHDAAVLFRAAPSPGRYAFLSDLLRAAAAAPAAAQAGLAAYLLLGPTTAALWDLHLVARGDSDCSAAVTALEASLIVHSGTIAWKRLLPRAKNNKGDPSTLSQDELFTRAVAARIVPRVVRYDDDLATSVCSMLAAAPKNATLAELLHTIGHTPDVQNVVLESALVARDSCNVSSTVEKALLEHLRSPVGADEGLMAHLRRSSAFILAASHDRETLQFLVHAVVLGEDDSVESGLREVDRVTLFHRIVRSSVEGFRAAAEIVQEYAEGTEDWEGSAVLLAELSPWTVAASADSLPLWLPVEQLSEQQRSALVLTKQSDSAAAQIVCAAQ